MVGSSGDAVLSLRRVQDAAAGSRPKLTGPSEYLLGQGCSNSLPQSLGVQRWGGGRDKRSEQGLKPSLHLSRGHLCKISLSGVLLLKCFWKAVLPGLSGSPSTVISL